MIQIHFDEGELTVPLVFVFSVSWRRVTLFFVLHRSALSAYEAAQRDRSRRRLSGCRHVRCLLLLLTLLMVFLTLFSCFNGVAMVTTVIISGFCCCSDAVIAAVVVVDAGDAYVARFVVPSVTAK